MEPKDLPSKGQIVVAGRAFGRFDPEGPAMLRRAGYELVYLPGKKAVRQELVDYFRDANTVGLVASAEPITAEMLDAAVGLKVIAVHGVASRHIDGEAARRRGIVVKAIPGGNAEAVADFTWGLMLAVLRKVHEADQLVRSNAWRPVVGTDLYGKTLAVVGFGAIGKAVARRASGFRMKVMVSDVLPWDGAEEKIRLRGAELDDMLVNADILSLHVPATAGNREMIAENELRRMKSSAVLINVSRGALVNEAALCRALQEGWIAGAGLDVFTKEPLPEDHCLRNAPNCVLTPHVAGHTAEALRFMGIQTARNILEALEPGGA
ncbi:MAG: phosphoglycerate dehydrogenase [Anaerolineaceae bacterium]|nr:phosphoglycerate dehydrogenase [Anaerolineaceae bacterium]